MYTCMHDYSTIQPTSFLSQHHCHQPTISQTQNAERNICFLSYYFCSQPRALAQTSTKKKKVFYPPRAHAGSSAEKKIYLFKSQAQNAERRFFFRFFYFWPAKGAGTEPRKEKKKGSFKSQEQNAERRFFFAFFCFCRARARARSRSKKKEHFFQSRKHKTRSA